MALFLGNEKLDVIRRRRRKTLAQVAADSGLKIGAVWRVLHDKCYDLRKVARVCEALSIPLGQLRVIDDGDGEGDIA